MKILLVSSANPKNILSWSGTTKSIYSALQSCADELVTFHSKPKLMKLLSRIVFEVTKKKGDFYKTTLYSKYLANKIEKIIEFEKPDIIIGVAGTAELAYVTTNVPIIHISDATYMSLHDYHPDHLKVWDWSSKSANHLEQQIINNADFVVLPSEWASKSATEDYGCNPQKIMTIPFGANLAGDIEPPKKTSVGIDKPCKLLFVGVNWKYKGGDIALSAMQALRNKGIDAELLIIGCIPPAHISSPYMKVISSLDKNKPNEYKELVNHFTNSTFLFVPTLSEAFGIVFAEAAMFGLPSISHATGGVPSVIDHNKTGYLLPIGSSGNDFADAIEQILMDDDKYQEMSRIAYLKYEKQLSWQAWQISMSKIINDCLISAKSL